MSLSETRVHRRKLLALLVLAPVAACGFTPVHAPGSTANTLRGRVEVGELTTPDGYELVRNLEDRLGRSAAPAYRLDLALEVEAEGQGITASGNITRFSLVGRVQYLLLPAGSDTPRAAGDVGSFTGYSATGTTVDTLAAERDARLRLMAILADKLVTELYATADLNT